MINQGNVCGAQSIKDINIYGDESTNQSPIIIK